MALAVKALAPADPGYAVMPALTRLSLWTAAGLLGYGVISWAVTQPRFALTELDVTTPVQHVTEAQLRLVADRKVRGTFFTVDLDRVRNSLQKLPWVDEARVERRWPGTLEVAITEHVPLARWNTDEIVSTRGRVFSAAVSEPLPRLSGPEGSAPQVIEQWHAFSKTLAPLKLSVDQLALSSRHAWTMKLSDGTRITLGRADVAARLARFVALYPALFADAAPQTVDLRYPDGFAVRPADGRSLIPPTRPEPASTALSTT